MLYNMDAELLLGDHFALDERSFVQMKVWKDVDTLWEARK